MKIEVKQRTVMPLRYRSTGKYNELLAACRNLRETEALQVEPDSGQSVKSLMSGVKSTLKREGLTSFVVVQDATSVWVSRKVSAASPAAPEQNGRTAVPFGGAPVAVGR